MLKIIIQNILLIFLLISLTGCLSLAEDITPPPGFSTPTSQATENLISEQQDVRVSIPKESPDPNKGSGIFVEKCASCHGETGKGDGPDAAMLENSPPSLGSISLARGVSPVDWYIIVTQGNMKAFMPPFSSLSEQERWDVIAYLFTLSASPEVISQGETLFMENCTECHSKDSQEGVIDLTDPAYMNERTSEYLIEMITKGHESMPAFKSLDLNQLWALTAYLRQSTFIPFEPQIEPEIAKTDETSPELALADSEHMKEAELPSGEEEKSTGFVDIEVYVQNNSDDKLPSNLEIVLRGYDEMLESYTQTLLLQTGTGVQFQDVPLKLGRIYFATIEHDNATYGSNAIKIEEDISSLFFEIPYYPPTTSTAILEVDRIHIFIDFIEEQTLEIVQLYIFSNPSNQVLVPKDAGGIVVNFDVPANARNLYVEENIRLAYQKTDTGFGITSIYPDIDPYQAVFSYQIPYNNKKLDLSIPLGMDANALIVLAPANGFKVKSDFLEDAGTRQFEGVSYNMFTGSGLGTGNSLLLNLSGRPKLNTNLLASTGDSKISLVIGFTGFGLALIATGLILRQQNKVDNDEVFDHRLPEEPDQETADDIMDAIIALDDQYRSGSLPQEAYHQRRAVLKERLRVIVESE